MGSVFLRRWKHAGEIHEARYYTIRYRDEEGRWHQHLTDPPVADPKAAADQLKITEAAILRGTFKPKSARGDTLGGVLDAYERMRRARDAKRFARNDSFVLERIKDAAPLAKLATVLSADDVREIVAAMFEDDVSPSTRRYPIVMLKAALNQAVDEGRIAFNPIARMKNPMPRTKRDVTWSREELEAVARELPEWAARVTCVGALTLLRLGDILRLERSWARHARLYPQIEKGDHAGGARPLSPVLIASLPQGPGRWYFPSGRGGRPYTLAGFRSRWIVALRKTGLTKKRWFHDLRRTGSEVLIRQRFPDLVVDDALDHVRRDILGKYPQVRQDTRDKAFNALAKWWGPTVLRVINATAKRKTPP
jgi:hypothetical protein